VIKAQVITVGASYEAQVSLLTMLGTHGWVEVLDHDERGMSDVSVILVGPDWAGSSPELTERVVKLCGRQGDVNIVFVRENGGAAPWYNYDEIFRSSHPLGREICKSGPATLGHPLLMERIVGAARAPRKSDSPDITAMRAAAVGLREAADRSASAARDLERWPERSAEAQSDRLAALRSVEGILRVQATFFDDAVAERRIELAKVEMPAHVAESVDRTIREALAAEGK